MPATLESRRRRFARFAVAVLVYTTVVVLLGAIVRITGSGAGCGQHWPTCQGEVVHLPRSIETAIELSHRLTSGLGIVFAALLPVGAYRFFPPGHAARRAAVASLALMLVEALIGAALVLFRLVAEDASVARAVILPLHLVNTSLLLAAMAITARSSIRETLPLRWPRSGIEWLLLMGMAAILVVSGLGGVTALGDALFPVSPADDLASRIATDQATTAHFFQRMRIFHPVLAIVVGVFLVALGQAVAVARPAASGWARTVQILVSVQLLAGVANVLLSAPGWMQVTHLTLAIALWLALVFGWAASCDSSGADGNRGR